MDWNRRRENIPNISSNIENQEICRFKDIREFFMPDQFFHVINLIMYLIWEAKHLFQTDKQK